MTVAERNALVLANRGLAGSAAKAYRGRGIDYDDLVGWGILGLFDAADRWDPARGKFGTYAYWWIKRRMRDAIRDHSRPVRIPRHAWYPLAGWQRLAAEGRGPEAIAAALGLAAGPAACVAAAAVVADWPAAPDPAEAPARDGPPGDAADRAGLAEQVDRALALLSPRHAEVIRGRFWHDLKLRELAATLGVTKERVRQMQVQGLRRLRTALAPLDPAASSRD